MVFSNGAISHHFESAFKVLKPRQLQINVIALCVVLKNLRQGQLLVQGPKDVAAHR